MLSALMANHRRRDTLRTGRLVRRVLWIVARLDFLDAWVFSVFAFSFCGEGFDAELHGFLGRGL
jgi:hypothetical protein